VGRLEEERIDETKDGGVDADPEGEHDHRRRRESPRLSELPKGKPEVMEHISVMLRAGRLDSKTILQARTAAGAWTAR
jgi:hypothetical protein